MVNIFNCLVRIPCQPHLKGQIITLPLDRSESVINRGSLDQQHIPEMYSIEGVISTHFQDGIEDPFRDGHDVRVEPQGPGCLLSPVQAGYRPERTIPIIV